MWNKPFNIGIHSGLSEEAQKRILLTNFFIFIPFFLSFPGTVILIYQEGLNFSSTSFLINYAIGGLSLCANYFGFFRTAKIMMLFTLTMGTIFIGAGMGSDDLVYAVIRGFMFIAVFFPIVLFEEREWMWRIAGLSWIIFCTIMIEPIVQFIGAPSVPYHNVFLGKAAPYYFFMQVVIIGFMFWMAQKLDNETIRKALANYRNLAEELENRVRVRTDDLQMLNQKLLETSKFKSELLNVSAHDLKNPLQVIMMNAELLKADAGNANEVLSTGGIIFIHAQRMHQMVVELLKNSAGDELDFTLKKENVDVGHLINSVLSDNQKAADAKKITLAVSCETDCQIELDAFRIREVLDNLVSNAIKYSPLHTSVECHVLRNPNVLRIEIADQGPGLTEEDMERVFQPFARLSAKPTAGENSTGLGLSIAKRFVELHGGIIGVNSAGRGKGSTFWLEIPQQNV